MAVDVAIVMDTISVMFWAGGWGCGGSSIRVKVDSEVRVSLTIPGPNQFLPFFLGYFGRTDGLVGLS